MKKEKTFRFCEFCDTAIEACSPPSKEYYENGQIQIRDGVILLPEKIAKSNVEKGISVNNAKDISGVYCSKTCLYSHLSEITGGLNE